MVITKMASRNVAYKAVMMSEALLAALETQSSFLLSRDVGWMIVMNDDDDERLSDHESLVQLDRYIKLHIINHDVIVQI